MNWQYIKENKKDFDENKLKDGPGFLWFGDDDQTKLNYYLFTESVKKYNNIEAYYYGMIEGLDFSEFITGELIKKD